MWHQVDRGDIDKARKSLGYRLGHLLMRQQEELKSLRARHANERHVLETKQAELETLDAMIGCFVDEFGCTPQTGAAHQQGPTADAPDSALEQPLQRAAA